MVDYINPLYYREKKARLLSMEHQFSFGVCTECGQSLNDLLDGGEFDLPCFTMEEAIDKALGST